MGVSEVVPLSIVLCVTVAAIVCVWVAYCSPAHESVPEPALAHESAPEPTLVPEVSVHHDATTEVIPEFSLCLLFETTEVIFELPACLNMTAEVVSELPAHIIHKLLGNLKHLAGPVMAVLVSTVLVSNPTRSTVGVFGSILVSQRLGGLQPHLHCRGGLQTRLHCNGRLLCRGGLRLH